MIVRGSPYAMQFYSETPDTWPVGVQFRGAVKLAESSAAVLAVLSSAEGHVERVDDQNIIVSMPGAMTDLFTGNSIVFDLWRTDLPEPEHWGAIVTCAVAKPVSPRPLT